MSDTREEQRAAARFEAECASGNTISRALHRRELAEKDAQIRALADALLANGYVRSSDGLWHTDCCNAQNDGGASCFASCTQARAALRLAGRLP